ncbi:hypothetical protein C8F01DRAFT_1105514 [Mycena amicta]|nr:hypothetical protein C8F01DRAFT_1105514 [Mycena amicta]
MAQSLLLSQLPVEIILEVVGKLSLSDALSLVSTCSSLYTLSGQRSFWILILTESRLETPLLCPPYADLSQFSLEKLMGLAFSRLRLEANWSNSFPQVKRRAKAIEFGEKVEILSTLQGTGLALLHLPDSQKLMCWDTEAGSPEPVLPGIKTNGRIVGVSAPFELPGVSYVGVLIMQSEPPYTTERHIVTIRHADKNVTSFSTKFSFTTTPNGHYFESLFLTLDVVGTVFVENLHDRCMVSFTPIDRMDSSVQSESHIHLPQHISNDRDLTVCFAFHGHLYNLIENSELVRIQHISRKSLSSGRCEETTLFTANVGESALRPFCFILPSNPVHGIAAAFIHATFDENDEKIQVIFLPAHLTYASEDDGELSPLAFPPECEIANIIGRPADISLVWMDHSGCNVVLVVDDFGGYPEVQDGRAFLLVRYNREWPLTTVHLLGLPLDINVYHVTAVSVDDTTGAVHLVDEEGVFTTLYYV